MIGFVFGPPFWSIVQALVDEGTFVLHPFLYGDSNVEQEGMVGALDLSLPPLMGAS